jgi:hypothetical protein
MHRLPGSPPFFVEGALPAHPVGLSVSFKRFTPDLKLAVRETEFISTGATQLPPFSNLAFFN